MLSRMYLHVFIGSNTTRLTQNLQQALCRVRSYFDGDTQEALPLFEGLLAYLCGDLKKNIDWFNRCSEETPWYYKRFYDTLAVCTLFFPQGICSNSILRLAASSFFGARRR
ncbi:MAG: hypothetical protein ACLR0N_08280 [Bilophila wadsworthia]